MSRYDAARRDVRHYLLNLPLDHKNYWSEDVNCDLLSTLFYISWGKSDGSEHYKSLLFPAGLPEPRTRWSLREAQGATAGSEYSESARGKPCGHILAHGEATYCCRTCTDDDTCVLCARCFHASNHEGHNVTFSISKGGGGCCDCGDPEAWNREVPCSIHTRHNSTSMEDADHDLPTPIDQNLQDSLTGTISAALDYVIDVLSCSSETMTVPEGDKAVEIILKEERMSRLQSSYGSSNTEPPDKEFVLILWNDEKHSVDEVVEQVSRAARRPRSFGKKTAVEVDALGRSIVSRSEDVRELVRQARILNQIKLTTTIRSSRDTFREQMCERIVDWIKDIATCSVGNDHHFLMSTVCEQLLQPWRVGSSAHNLAVAKHGHEDHSATDGRLDARQRLMQHRMMQQRMRQWQQQAQQGRREMQADVAGADGDTDVDDDQEDDDDEGDVEDDFDEDTDMMDADQDVILTIGDETTGDNLDLEQLQDVIEQGREVQEQPHDSQDESGLFEFERQSDPDTLCAEIPRLRGSGKKNRNVLAASHWLNAQRRPKSGPAPHVSEDLGRRVRIDHLIFYDMRMFKTFRQGLRQLYTSTLVATPKYKRILSLRFAELYDSLCQLYLLADREYESSIITLSIQMLTTPSIAKEIVVERNFLTRLLAVLYTFLTTHQVGEPQDVDPTATIMLDSSSLSNRRFYHMFHDITCLLDVAAVKDFIKVSPDCLLQFLDFAKLSQGICPNERVIGEHVEYESDAWSMAQVLTRNVSMLSKQFSGCFYWTPNTDPSAIVRALKAAARAATLNALGSEKDRFTKSEMNSLVDFKRLAHFTGVPSHDDCYRLIVHCEVEKTSISLWHSLHYILSWLIDAGKNMASQQLANLLKFDRQELQKAEPKTGHTPEVTITLPIKEVRHVISYYID